MGLHKHEGKIRLARTTATSNQDVLLEAVALEMERVQSLATVGHRAELDVAALGELFRRRWEWGPVWFEALVEMLCRQRGCPF